MTFAVEIKKFDENKYKFELRFNEVPVGYYPSEIDNIKGDILDEIDKLNSGRSHEIVMDGYTVAFAVIENGSINIIEPIIDSSEEIAIGVSLEDMMVGLKQALIYIDTLKG